ncbi:uncharacterized protein LOC110435976 [Sorghum bicolor]|uniref:uncharacterized protein LOC110435976 n=1 Tax=Sorghum bicolor TaxID=4558 RepID=UPI000B425391|nr:uncharacterized protein LOC110435976 [Sorghum bicolor]|eukprot:XP_021317777.1 uncharacterized protein LOC110435976 [Sorghum bicolor]
MAPRHRDPDEGWRREAARAVLYGPQRHRPDHCAHAPPGATGEQLDLLRRPHTSSAAVFPVLVGRVAGQAGVRGGGQSAGDSAPERGPSAGAGAPVRGVSTTPAASDAGLRQLLHLPSDPWCSHASAACLAVRSTPSSWLCSTVSSTVARIEPDSSRRRFPRPWVSGADSTADVAWRSSASDVRVGSVVSWRSSASDTRVVAVVRWRASAPSRLAAAGVARKHGGGRSAGQLPCGYEGEEQHARRVPACKAAAQSLARKRVETSELT